MKRRQFVQTSSAGVLGAFFVFPDASAHDLHPEELVLASPDSLKLLNGQIAIEDIGYAYRTKYAHEDDLGILKEKLRQSLGREVTKESVSHRVALDFEVGQVVQLNGWVLSVTEARQCALHSIIY